MSDAQGAAPSGGPATTADPSSPGELATMGVPIHTGMPDDVVTIGVAIEVPDPHGQELQRWRADFGDPLANAIPAHVTLLPPTVIAPEVTRDIEKHLEEVAADTRPFTMRLRGTGSFRPVSPVVFVCVYSGAAGCDALQQRIRTGPLHRELSFPYHPHVTVAHHLSDGALDRAQHTLQEYAADFVVDNLGLYEHGQDGVWRLKRRIAFGAGSRGNGVRGPRGARGPAIPGPAGRRGTGDGAA